MKERTTQKKEIERNLNGQSRQTAVVVARKIEANGHQLVVLIKIVGFFPQLVNVLINQV